MNGVNGVTEDGQPGDDISQINAATENKFKKTSPHKIYENDFP